MSDSEQAFGGWMALAGRVIIIGALPVGYCLACAFESLPGLATAFWSAPAVIGGALFCYGEYIRLRNCRGLADQMEKAPSKWVCQILCGELGLLGMFALTGWVMDVTQSGIGMCGPYGSGLYLLPLLGVLPVSLLAGKFAGRWLPIWIIMWAGMED